jgi:murein DD-endopeptidase MepM/ murein hydrolase activator NlpD
VGGLVAAAALGLIGLPIAVVLAVLLILAAAMPSAADPGTLSDEVPAAYRQAILVAAAACPGLGAPLLGAQLAAESGWDPAAVSPTGARGLAQFMPATWAAWGRDGDRDGAADVMNPLDAIAAQGALMCDLLDRAQRTGWGDPIDLALAGYNAGWGAVIEYHGVPAYPETRAYIDRIRTSLPRYVGTPPTMPGDAGEVVWPVADPDPLRNGFGDRPPGIDYELGYHTGIDLNADARLGGSDYGQPVRAARAGVVHSISHRGPLGNQVLIGHPDGHYSSSGHLASITVAPGQQVTAGQQIGTIGCSGMRSCAPHLHFEIRRSPAWTAGNFVDPLDWLGLGRP